MNEIVRKQNPFRQVIQATADQMLLSAIVLQLKSFSASDLYENNKTFLRMLSIGIIRKR